MGLCEWVFGLAGASPRSSGRRVLLFAGEDALPLVRRGLEGIAHAAGVAFDALDIHVITTPSPGNGKYSITQRDRRVIKKRPMLDARQVSRILS